MRADSTAHGPWNPGIESPVSGELLPLCTIFRPENVNTRFREARELRGLTGLDYTDLVAFRPLRLALHEVLIRVSADFSVPDGDRIEDLGINFRHIVNALFTRHVEPRADEIEACYADAREALTLFITREAASLRAAGADTTGPQIIARWEATGQSAGNPVERAACRALAKVVAAILARHGRLWGTPELIASIAITMACNEYGSEAIGKVIEPWLAQAAAQDGHRLLPSQAHPIVMNTKGASASGKSTIRPLQRRLADERGMHWSDFALISPDIWRKQLLDYGSLGSAYKYAGPFTGDELQIVDQKLDQYMAQKAARGRMSHLLIDRFRFDSFAPDSDVAASNLLTRFGSIVYLFFMITPPGELVERAWHRGLDVGRYKAVDDTLAHAVEAYAGMPELFFSLVGRTDKRVHFEFLDNAVPPGTRPRTVAYGWNDTVTVLDVKRMLDVVRYRRVNPDASSPDALFRDPGELAPAHNTEFLEACALRFREACFGDPASGRIYLRLVGGAPVWCDREGLARACEDRDTRAGLEAAAPAAFEAVVINGQAAASPEDLLAAERPHTVGQWGA